MKFYYINLASSKERNDHMIQLAKKVGLEFIRFEAVVPTVSSLLRGQHTSFYRKSCNRFKKYINNKDPRIVRRGCAVFGVYMSHYFLHKYHEFTSPDEKYVIMEDDIGINKNIMEKIINRSNSSDQKGWDIFRSVWRRTRNPVRRYPLDESFVIKGVHSESKYASETPTKHSFFGGAHFSIFNKSSSMINYLEDESLYAIDAVYSTEKLKVVCGNFGVKYNLFDSLIPKKKHYKT